MTDQDEALLEQAKRRFTEGDLAGAMADVNALLATNAENHHALHLRAVVRIDQKDFDGAAEDLEATLKLAPDDARAYYNRGYLRSLRQETDAAIADYDQALALCPDYPRALDERAFLRREAGDLEGSLADYDRLVELQPENAAAYTGRGTSRHMADDLQGALADYDRALALDARQVQAAYNRGCIWKDRGLFREALADYEQALEVNPSYAKAAEARDAVKARLESGVWYPGRCVRCCKEEGTQTHEFESTEIIGKRLEMNWIDLPVCHACKKRLLAAGKFPTWLLGIAGFGLAGLFSLVGPLFFEADWNMVASLTAVAVIILCVFSSGSNTRAKNKAFGQCVQNYINGGGKFQPKELL